MKLLLSATSAFLAFAGLAAASPAFAPRDSGSDARRLRLEPEFASLFTNASFVRDPTYQKDMAELHEMIAALNGGSSRSNKVKAAADPSHKSHGKHYCVGQAWEPHRTRIFENRMDCDIEGWSTVVSFCIPKTIVTSSSLSRVEGCVGKAGSPTRSMYFKGHKDCNRDGWKHDFQLPVQDAKGPVHFLEVWEAHYPFRMNVSPGGSDLVPSGWTYRAHIPAYTITYAMTPSGLKTIKPHLSKIVSIHKRGLGDSGVSYVELNITISAILVRALQYLVHGIYQATQGATIQRFTDINEVRSVAREFYDRTVNIELVRTHVAAGGFEGNLVTIELRADGVTAATLMMDENVHYGQGWIREALITSMMQRVTVMLVRVRDIPDGRYRGYIYGRGKDPIDLGFQ
ncbi:hypothetical protein BG006_001401 [Podila minutissima]|uniref:Uncharacterized protein n=1 Tax=Podila minutissima TaxID=64525 RepID=A0A9P5VH89_9FUNG|nr:hypothetical protein BG006_001401 [Podila minutissima]